MLYFHLIRTSHPQFCPLRKHLLFSLLIFGRVSGTGNQHPHGTLTGSQLSKISWHLNLPLNLTLTLALILTLN